MKRIRLVLCLIFAVVLTACGSSQAVGEDDNSIVTEYEKVASNDLVQSDESKEENVELTVAPTEEPTIAPTEEPTIAPTEEPDVEPTEEPTLRPMEELAEVQNIQSTTEPEVKPTENPVAQPVVVTTPKPTVVPTVAPTVAPTAPTEVETPMPAPVVTDAPVIATPAPTEHVHTMVWNWWQEEELEGERCTVRRRAVDICADCGYIQNVCVDWYVDTDCEMGEVVWIQEKTCLQDGLYTQYCIKCGWQRDVDVSPAKGEHTMCQTTLSIVGATCSTEGSEVIKHYCQYCDEVTYEETIVRPINEYHPASCFSYENEEGQLVRLYTCYECGLVWEEIW